MTRLAPSSPSLLPLLLLLLTVVLWIPVGSYHWGQIPALLFILTLTQEPPERRKRYLALAASVALLSIAPISTDLSNRNFMALGSFFFLAIAVPTAILYRERIITYKLFPDKLEWLEVFYTLLAIPIAWAAFQIYFNLLSPHVPFNWVLPPDPENTSLFRLFIGINGVGIWDELFFINVSYAIIRSLFPYRIANPAQAVIYTSILYAMAFRGVGPVFVYAFALTQGAMYERSRVLLWVLIAHLIVDYFLYQAIIEAHFPGLQVWWH